MKGRTRQTNGDGETRCQTHSRGWCGPGVREWSLEGQGREEAFRQLHLQEFLGAGRSRRRALSKGREAPTFSLDPDMHLANYIITTHTLLLKHRGSERGSDLPEVTQPANGTPGA